VSVAVSGIFEPVVHYKRTLTVDNWHKNVRSHHRQILYRLNKTGAEISLLAAIQLAIELCCKCRQHAARIKLLFCKDPLLSLGF
jgi:hypothetical protein